MRSEGDFTSKVISLCQLELSKKDNSAEDHQHLQCNSLCVLHLVVTFHFGRHKPPSSGVTLVDPEGEKTPSKQITQEIIPNCQTPPNQTLEVNSGCYTPTNPSPDRSHVCHIPTTDSSTKKKSTDDGISARVLRPRGDQAGREVDMSESRQLRSSPRLSNSSNTSSSPNKVVDSATSKDVKNKRLSSEKTSDEKSAKRASRPKAHSTSSSPVAGSSKCGTGASSLPSNLIHLSPDDKPKEREKRSSAQSIEKTRLGLRARDLQQDSSDESSGKENQAPESLATEENVTRSTLRSRASRVTQPVPDENRIESKDQVQSQDNVKEESKREVQLESPKRTCLRSASKSGLPERCSENEDRLESREGNVQEKPEREIHMASPKMAFLKSPTRKNLSEPHSKNDVREKSRETNMQTEYNQDLQMESPKKSSLKSAAMEKLSERHSVNDSLVKSRNEESVQDIHMESPKKSSLRSAVKETLQGCCGEKKDCVESFLSNVHEELDEDIEMKSPIRNSLRSAVKETLQGCCRENKDCVECLVPNVQEEVKQAIQMESHKRACLRSSTKENLSERGSAESTSKTAESPQKEEQNLERKERTRSSPKTTKQPSDESNSANVTKSSEISPGDQQITFVTVQTDSMTRITRSRAQSAPASTVKLCDDADTTDNTKSMISCSITQESVEQEHMERRVELRDRPVSCAECEPQKNIALSKAGVLEATKTKNKQDTNQSLGKFTRGSEVVAEVEIKLPDCRQLCVIRKRPVLETESDESETESIQLSSGETLLKQSSSENAFSDGKEDDISSTPTLEYCPSPVSSEKSGYSEEAPLARKYSLRKREDQDDHDPCPGKRTRSQCKIPDVDSEKGDRVESRQRKTISSPFTSVKAKRKSSNQGSQSAVASPKKRTPEKKAKDSGRKKGTSNNSPREKAMKQKDPTSESDSSTFSGSPRSGPIQDTSSTRASTVHSAVRNLEEETAEDTEEGKESLLLSDSALSFGDISTTAVCGSPHHVSASPAGIKLLNWSPLIKKDFHSASFLDKRGMERSGVTRLFESDDEEEDDFIGFNVPHFDRSFPSEGDLSCKINSIVESMDGDASQTTLEDEDNTTIHEAPSCEEEMEMRENIEGEIETATGKDINRAGERGKLGFEEDEEIRQADDTRFGRKRKSSQIENSIVKRSNWSESQSETRSTTESFSVVDNDHEDDDDFDEDDDVFSTVADSSDGEEQEEIVASPFSISSWGRKRKSEDLQLPEVERPTKRRKSQKGTAIDHTCVSSQSSRAETPVKRGACQEMGPQKENEKPTSFSSRLDELQDGNQRKRVQSSSSVQDSDSFYDSDVSVYETIEERVKLRRIRKSSQKEHENPQSLPRTQAHRKDDSTELAATGKTEGRLPPLKPLRKHTLQALKPLKHVSPVRSSSRLSRNNSTSSANPSPLPAPSGRSRRGTWIYDVNEFTSPPSAAPRFGVKPVTCSTPASTIPSSRRVLRPLKHDKMAEDSILRKSRERDVFVFDE